LTTAAFIQIGDYHLQCLLTPGHTEGHICLYEEKKQILFSGDHVLYDITPHIESWSYEVNSLKNYLESLDMVRNLPSKSSFPDIAISFTDLKGRIDELKKHHQNRVKNYLKF